MRYIILIYSDESGADQVTEAQFTEVMNAYNAYTAEMQSKGVMEAGEALHPTRAATTVRVRDGKALTTDGPFAETKEALGGYYVVNCKDLDEAIMWAAKCPGAMVGSIEVRPIMEFPQ
jgi:hypothetical protein